MQILLAIHFVSYIIQLFIMRGPQQIISFLLAGIVGMALFTGDKGAVLASLWILLVAHTVCAFAGAIAKNAFVQAYSTIMGVLSAIFLHNLYN